MRSAATSESGALDLHGDDFAPPRVSAAVRRQGLPLQRPVCGGVKRNRPASCIEAIREF